MTYVYKELTTSDIAQALKQDEDAGWTYGGAHALAEWLENFAEETGTPIAFDGVALRCDFDEYSSAEEAYLNYNDDGDSLEGVEEDERAGFCLDWLQDKTTVITFEGGVIVQAF